MDNVSVTTVHLRVLDKSKKTKFLHFVIENVPKFQYPEELKSYLVENHQNAIQPVQGTNFKLGYFVEGRGNKRFDIVDQTTLQQAYSLELSGRICLWVDPHSPCYENRNMTKTKSKRKPIARPESSDEEESGELRSHSRKRAKIEEKLEVLQSKHSGKWPDYKLRSWANMLAIGTHTSVEEPPNVPYFRENASLKKKQGQGIAESVAAAVAATITTLGHNSQAPAAVENHSHGVSSKIAIRGQLISQLKEIKELKDAGILSDIEYEEQKNAIINEMKA